MSKPSLAHRRSAIALLGAFAIVFCSCGDSGSGGEAGAGAASGAGPAGSSGSGGGAAGTTATLQWFTTCGAPVCGGPNTEGPTGESPCTAEQIEGGSCSDENALCDPGVGCLTNLVCAASDPKLAPGGCPISRARYKRDIAYVSEEQRAQLAEAILALPLATFRYRGGDDTEQLGFILEDAEPSPSVDAPRDRVNLYGYTTMAVAAVQEQQHEIAALRAEVEALRAELRQDAPMCVP